LSTDPLKMTQTTKLLQCNSCRNTSCTVRPQPAHLPPLVGPNSGDITLISVGGNDSGGWWWWWWRGVGERKPSTSHFAGAKKKGKAGAKVSATCPLSFLPPCCLGFVSAGASLSRGRESVPTGSLPSQAPGLVFPLSAEETRLDSERAEGSQITDRAKRERERAK
jgi:hypothetical protein